MALLLGGGGGSAAAPDAVGIEFFEKRIRPILVEHCYRCHSASVKNPKGGLRLDTREGILKGGDSGPALVPGDVERSLLIRAIRYQDQKLVMPPRGKLSAEAIADLERWVKLGAPDPRDGKQPVTTTQPVDRAGNRDFWSLQPLRSPEPPPIKTGGWDRTSIDRFILTRQEATGLTPAPPASRRVLIRRAYFDLIGLPPTPAEMDAAILDQSEKWFEKLIDQLLASPHHGERWARHWLDVARFAESDGFEFDADRKSAYPYRDFVIWALNEDLPYDRFVRWQIAGDLLEPTNPLAQVATGFLVAGVENKTQTRKEQERDRYDKLDDMVATVGTAFLGLTVGCARCHDHKYDPISQRDYYGLLATFGKTQAIQTPLALGGHFNLPQDAKPVSVYRAQGDAAKDVHFLIRGDFQQKQSLVTQDFPSVLMRGEKNASYWQRTTSPRTALADWITDVEHGAGHLLARVMVNRLWQRHFGQGLVATASDFGLQGARPTHSELLDWLATELIRCKWQLKPIHRLIMTSAVYQQGHQVNATNVRLDPRNQLLWRHSPRRLDAEVIRDAMLAVSGLLDRSLYGPGTLSDTSRRRSIYFTVKRSRLTPALQLFDAPDALQGVGARNTTTVPSQALWQLNNSQVRQCADALAARLLDRPERSLEKLIDDGYRQTLAREPEAAERAALLEFFRLQMRSHRDDGSSERESRQRATVEYCQMLLCVNEFIYVE
jgi:hypothetical protein